MRFICLLPKRTNDSCYVPLTLQPVASRDEVDVSRVQYSGCLNPRAGTHDCEAAESGGTAVPTRAHNTDHVTRFRAYKGPLTKQERLHFGLLSSKRAPA